LLWQCPVDCREQKVWLLLHCAFIRLLLMLDLLMMKLQENIATQQDMSLGACCTLEAAR
jgi:hypothetical protein